MSKINEKLIRSKDEALQFEHNGQIKAFLVELGLGSQFRQNPYPDKKETIQSILHFDHATHLVLVAFYSGYDDERQNGYLLWCLPKSKTSHQEFMEFSKQALSLTAGGIIEAGTFPTGPGDDSN